MVVFFCRVLITIISSSESRITHNSLIFWGLGFGLKREKGIEVLNY
jgi:hypothetical protein